MTNPTEDQSGRAAFEVPMPEPLFRADQGDDGDVFGSLQDHAYDSDYSVRVNDPLYTADQVRDYMKAATQAASERIAELEAQLAETQAGATQLDKMATKWLEDFAAAGERCGELQAQLDGIDDNLNFEPDDNHTIADMANVGHALMRALPEGYVYSNSPAEIVGDLINERDQLQAELKTARDAAESAMNDMACLIANPGNEKQGDWPCENPADRECLSDAYRKLRDLTDDLKGKP